MLLGCRQRFTLGPPADRPCELKARRGLASAREDEALELGQLVVEPVALALQRLHLALRDPQPPLALERHNHAFLHSRLLVQRRFQVFGIDVQAVRQNKKSDRNHDKVRQERDRRNQVIMPNH